ncbi:MAG: hydratase [Deltaproteobacteria bacterium]|jgi:aconitate hydratase|nr:hydratase [Deltaproteobacteria bacterium]
MIAIHKNGGRLRGGLPEPMPPDAPPDQEGFRKTIAWKILKEHNHSGQEDKLRLRFDALISHDITYVGIVQTARAGGMKHFTLPYVLTNCHNSLCAVGGTINEDDHAFGLSAARRYGGDYVPAHLAVLHQYARETMAACGRMILGSDSHTRYGALGCMGVGEGGPELVKQLLERPYELNRPETAGIYLKGRPKPGVGPQDVALALIRALFKEDLVKNRVMEFFGPGLAHLSTEYRMGIDVMTTETACLSSVWQTDARVRKYLALHGRETDYRELAPEEGAFYDLLVEVDLERIRPMIALPFHPSNAHGIDEFLANAEDILAQVEQESLRYAAPGTAPDLRGKFRRGRFMTDQAVIAGCSGGSYENIRQTARLLAGRAAGRPGYALSVYPASQPILLALLQDGHAAALTGSGAILRTAFCGPCFGAGDVPGHNGFSIRHATRNFPNREGSLPAGGQMAFAALMDARSIAATVMNGGALTAADQIDFPAEDGGLEEHYTFDQGVYARMVYRGWQGKPGGDAGTQLVLGPNIADWPPLSPLPENLLLTVASAIYDPVTTTDELIPSGETSSYRSNPRRLAEFTLFRKDPAYLGRAKAIQHLEETRQNLAPGAAPPDALWAETEPLRQNGLLPAEPEQDAAAPLRSLGLGSLIFALRPGDGSAREQAASCQKILGGWANLAQEYATKRYRSNLINWGLLPLRLEDWAAHKPAPGDRLYIPNTRQAVRLGLAELPAYLLRAGQSLPLRLRLDPLTEEEKEILLAGCLMNYYASGAGGGQ